MIRDDYDTAIDKLDEYFAPKKNVDSSFALMLKTQYTTRLRKLAQNCEFNDLNLIQNCLSKRLRRIALRDDLTLDTLIGKARSMEMSETQASGMEQLSASVNQLHVKRPPRKFPMKQTHTPSNQCRKCGLTWPHKEVPCPAIGKTCKKCDKPNHFARVCLSKTTMPRSKQQWKGTRRILFKSNLNN